MGFSLLDKYRAWRARKTPAKPAEPVAASGEKHGGHKERADAYLQKMAETLLNIEKKSTERAVHEHPHHHEAAHERRAEHHETVRVIEERHETLLPKHEEPKQLEDHHQEHPMNHAINLHARGTNEFHAQNGETYWTLSDLGDALVRMSGETFAHHTADGRNDFAAWIEGCFTGAEQGFAQRLRGQDREGMLRAFLEAKGMPTRVEPERPVVVEIPVDEPAREAIPAETSPQPAEHVVETPTQHHDDKAPVSTFAVHTEHHEGRHELVKHLIEGLNQAHAEAAKDLAAAREKFIALRTRIFGELSDEERQQVLPTLRHTYEHLRQAH